MRFFVVLVACVLGVIPTTVAKLDCTPVSNVSPVLGTGKVLLLGELHGTRESPAFAATVACHAAAKGLPVVVGLELASVVRPHLDEYLKSAGSEADRGLLVRGPMWQRSYQDGRTSRAIVQLIESVRQLHHGGHAVEILLFDASGGSGAQQRDRDMAANVLGSAKRLPKAMHVILTGNQHSRTSPGTRGNSEFEPMGYVIKQALGARRVVSLNVGYTGGSAWICSSECGIVQLGGHSESQPGTIEMNDKTRPAGHDGWYFVGAISASPPASGDFCRNEFEYQQSTMPEGYRAFDQTPGEGWRRLSEVQCQPEAVKLIEHYLGQYGESLSAGERRILEFHAGQLLAFDDRNQEAIRHIKRAINESEPDDAPFKWNAYVRATLAFLGGNRAELVRQRELVANGASQGGSAPNLHVVDGLLEHFGQSYRAAAYAPRKDSSTAVSTTEAASPAFDPAATPSASPKKWQGRWQAYEYGAKSWTIRFDGRKFYAVIGPDDWYHGTIALRPETEPAEIDFMIEECRCTFAGKTSEAIFAWDGDAVTLATPQPGSARPTVFDESSGQVVRLEKLDD